MRDENPMSLVTEQYNIIYVNDIDDIHRINNIGSIYRVGE